MQVLLLWFKQVWADNATVSGSLMMEQANVFAEIMKIELKANHGW